MALLLPGRLFLVPVAQFPTVSHSCRHASLGHAWAPIPWNPHPSTATLLQVELLQRDAALYKARIEELERDFMKIDVLGNLEAAGGDEQLQKAWEIASTFKKRCGAVVVVVVVVVWSGGGPATGLRRLGLS